MSDKRDSVQFSRLVVSDSLQLQANNIKTSKFSILGLGRSPIYFLLELAFTIISYFYFSYFMLKCPLRNTYRASCTWNLDLFTFSYANVSLNNELNEIKKKETKDLKSPSTLLFLFK